MTQKKLIFADKKEKINPICNFLFRQCGNHVIARPDRAVAISLAAMRRLLRRFAPRNDMARLFSFFIGVQPFMASALKVC